MNGGSGSGSRSERVGVVVQSVKSGRNGKVMESGKNKRTETGQVSVFFISSFCALLNLNQIQKEGEGGTRRRERRGRREPEGEGEGEGVGVGEKKWLSPKGQRGRFLIFWSWDTAERERECMCKHDSLFSVIATIHSSTRDTIRTSHTQDRTYFTHLPRTNTYIRTYINIYNNNGSKR